MQLKFGIAIPRTNETPVDAAQLARFLARIDAAPEYESIWVSERILGTIPMLEPIALLSYAAALTRRARLGVAILVVPLRNPVQLAKSLASLDQLSGGRLVVGVGAGPDTKNHVPAAFGLPAGRRGDRLGESVELMKRLWTQSRIDFAGEFWKLENQAMEPKPFQKPHPPLWFGGGSEPALRRAASMGNGWIAAGGSSNAQFREDAPKVRRYLEEAKRDPSSFAIAKRVYIAIDENKARAGERLTQWFGTYYGSGDHARRVAIYGGRAECVDRLAELASSGAKFLLLEPVFDEAEHVAMFSEEIIPALRRA